MRYILWAILLGAGTISAQTTVKISAQFGEQELVLGETYQNSRGDQFTFSTLKFYLTSFSAQDENGKVLNSDDCFLIDLENAVSLTILHSTSKIKSVSFLLGTDSLTNVAGILDGPLDPIHGMYWAWNSGYINFKVEGTSNRIVGPKHEFEYHIGGYLQPYATFRSFNFTTDSAATNVYIEVDLMKWIDSFDISENANVMIPGKLAFELADQLQQSIRLSYAE